MLLLEYEMMVGRILKLYKSSGDPLHLPRIERCYCNRAVKLQMLKICGFLFNHLFPFSLDENSKVFSKLTYTFPSNAEPSKILLKINITAVY